MYRVFSVTWRASQVQRRRWINVEWTTRRLFWYTMQRQGVVRGKCTHRTTTRHTASHKSPLVSTRKAPFSSPLVVFAHSRVRLYGALNASGKSLIEFSPPRSLLVLFAFSAIKVGNVVNILSIRGSRNWGDNEDNSISESREFHTL